MSIPLSMEMTINGGSCAAEINFGDWRRGDHVADRESPTRPRAAAWSWGAAVGGAIETAIAGQKLEVKQGKVKDINNKPQR